MGSVVCVCVWVCVCNVCVQVCMCVWCVCVSSLAELCLTSMRHNIWFTKLLESIWKKWLVLWAEKGGIQHGGFRSVLVWTKSLWVILSEGNYLIGEYGSWVEVPELLNDRGCPSFLLMCLLCFLLFFPFHHSISHQTTSSMRCDLWCPCSLGSNLTLP